ncbi:glycosyltransferase family 4 protein [Rhizosphaericola mali]|uniref:Glycosyltransferase family 4 protein n=1 Tax=Rhizosphaericola mali TaxID=2545455 RepID=A0A5P2FX43_9BACT|nr:glycosyltransferase family 4 protein [Rhizosphaericola mali]QES87487.1 glycosyltransferase family 4 protein [Rhizosphaericola mali]
MDDVQIKILSIAPYRFIPARFGGHKAIAFLYKYLSLITSFQAVTVVSQYEKTDLVQYSTFPILSDSVLRYANIFSIRKIGKIIKSEKITHIMTEHPYLGWMLYLIRIFYSKKIIVRSHNIEALRFKSIGKFWWKILYLYEAWVYKMADLVVFITPEDRNFAIQNFGVKPEKSSVITYGMDLPSNYSNEWKTAAHSNILAENQLSSSTRILLFNGDFGYKPNLDALILLVEDVLPKLNQTIIDFKLVVCGKSIPETITTNTEKNIIVKGFVDDIQMYFGGANVFINPIFDGGGIKTKLVEALSFNTPAVSFVSGAIGIPTNVIGRNLQVVEDRNVDAMVLAIQQQLILTPNLPSSFFTYFSWKNIAQSMLNDIRKIG